MQKIPLTWGHLRTWGLLLLLMQIVLISYHDQGPRTSLGEGGVLRIFLVTSGPWLMGNVPITRSHLCDLGSHRKFIFL